MAAGIALVVAGYGPFPSMIAFGAVLWGLALAKWWGWGVTCWPAGIVVELMCLLVEGLAMGVVGPQAERVWTSRVILMIPLLLALMLWWGRRSEGDSAGPRVSEERLLVAPLLATSFALLILRMTCHNDPSWAMSGDARNHILIMRSMLAKGGITLAGLKDYPSFPNAVVGFVAAASQRAGLAPGDLMLHDARALADVLALIAAGVATGLGCAVLHFQRKTDRDPRWVSVAVVSVFVASVMPVIIGTSLKDGYLTTYCALLLGVIATSVALGCARRTTTSLLPILSGTTVLMLVTLPVFTFVPAALVVDVAAVHWLSRRRLNVAILGSVALVAMATAMFLLHWTRFSYAVEIPGAIVAPQPYMSVLLVLAAWYLRRTTLMSVAGLLRVPLVVGAAGVLIAFGVAQLPGNSWNDYHVAKILYVTAGSLVWVPYAPIAYRARSARHSPGPRFGRSYVICVFLVLAFTSTLGNQFVRIAHGWDEPSTKSVAVVARYGNDRTPFILWDFSSAADDRAANFWAVTTWNSEPDARGSWHRDWVADTQRWAYGETNSMHDLCELAAYVPGIRVITRDRQLGTQTASACPGVPSPEIVVLDSGERLAAR